MEWMAGSRLRQTNKQLDLNANKRRQATGPMVERSIAILALGKHIATLTKT
jgi:hypothetical protein